MLTDKISKLNEDHEYVKDFGTYIIAVDKIGGGTVGKSYDGDWTGTVYDIQGRQLGEEFGIWRGLHALHQYIAEMIYQDMVGEW